jgi:predicted Zn finger-like uncharacterized protein
MPLSSRTAGRACLDESVKMSGMKNFYPGTGTTLCPHCGTRFKITKAQLEAHQSLVRCGHCLQAFDTRSNFAPEEIDPQLELPILYEDEAPSEQSPAERLGTAAPGSLNAPVLLPLTLIDHAAFMPDVDRVSLSKRRSWLWMVAALPLLLLLLAQATYLFRVELAARLPGLKPTLVRYCQILKCSVPLPQHASLMSIESSELKDVPAHRNQIILIALLRNRATYAQALPNLELTLTDSQDKALARRIFHPEDYLLTPKNLTVGLSANQELGIKLHLDTADLKPVGYRLVLFYSNGQIR